MELRRHLWAAALIGFALAAAVRSLPAAEQSSVATLAHIKLSGSLGEAPLPSDPLFGSGAENFKSKLDRIKKAKNDADIHGLYLEIEDLSVGWGKLDELRNALADFRKADKKVFAYLESANTKDYVLAASCDAIGMPESGWLMLTGLRAEVTFYKDLFDKIGIKADMLKMGAFKSAVEPYTRTSMSKEARGQLETVLDDFFEKELVEKIVEGRSAKKKLTAEQVKKLIDEGPFTAKAALTAGLVDRVAYAEKFQDSLKSDLEVERVKVSRNYVQAKAEELNLTNPFDVLKLFKPSGPTSSSRPKVAVIYATGMIVTGKSTDGGLLGGELCGSTTMIEAIRQAEQDKSVKAIVLRVDSPGGSALASDLIWSELRRCKKPIIASMSDVAASGGYYISMGAQKIYAEPGTLTGSIGVFGGKMTIAGVYDKLGIATETITRGTNAGILSMTTPFSDSERKAMTALIRDVYDQFLDKAIDCRKRAGKDMTKEHLENDLAGGRVWTGRQALKQGLVDELGTLGDAIASARKIAGMPEDPDGELLILPKPRSLFDTLMDLKSDSMAPGIGVQPLLRTFPELAGSVRSVEGLLRLRGEPVWVFLPYQVEVR